MLHNRPWRKSGREKHGLIAVVLLVSAASGAMAEPVELSDAWLDAVTAGAADGRAEATAEALGFGRGATTGTSVLASLWQGLGTDGWTGRAAAVGAGSEGASLSGSSSALEVQFLSATSAGTAESTGAGSRGGLMTEGTASQGSGLTLSLASIGLVTQGRGSLDGEAAITTQVPDARGGPGRSLAISMTGQADDGSLALSGRTLILKGPLRGLVFLEYDARACCGGDASTTVETTFAPLGQPIKSASRGSESIRSQSGASWALSSFGQSLSDIGEWR